MALRLLSDYEVVAGLDLNLGGASYARKRCPLLEPDSGFPFSLQLRRVQAPAAALCRRSCQRNREAIASGCNCPPSLRPNALCPMVPSLDSRCACAFFGAGLGDGDGFPNKG